MVRRLLTDYGRDSRYFVRHRADRGPGRRLPNETLVVDGGAFDLGPDGTAFAEPVRVTISYAPGDVPTGADQSELGLYLLDGGVWSLIPGSTVDVDEGVVSGELEHFSTVAAATPRFSAVYTAPDETQTVTSNSDPIRYAVRGGTWEVYVGAATSTDTAPSATGFGVALRCSWSNVTCMTAGSVPASRQIFLGTYSGNWIDNAPPVPAFTDAECRGRDTADRNVTTAAHELGHVLQIFAGHARPTNADQGAAWEAQAQCLGLQIMEECGQLQFRGVFNRAAIRAALDCMLASDVFPPAIPRCNTCGDVHIRTPDGLFYDFQGPASTGSSPRTMARSASSPGRSRGDRLSMRR